MLLGINGCLNESNFKCLTHNIVIGGAPLDYDFYVDVCKAYAIEYDSQEDYWNFVCEEARKIKK